MPVANTFTTRILLTSSLAGDAAASDQLSPIIYEELRRLARAMMTGERAGHTLDATGLVHEAFLKLAGDQPIDAVDKAHFMCLAARAMRQILVDHARTRRRLKRGGGAKRIELDSGLLARPESEAYDDLDVSVAVDELARLSPRQAQIVELKHWGGHTMAAVAEIVGVKLRTVEADWTMAKVKLREILERRAG